MKNDEVNKKILECAREEFLEKGYKNASMRSIAKKAGYTTGILYGRFADKDQMFRALVDDGAEQFYNYFHDAQENFAGREPEQQVTGLHGFVDEKVGRMIDIIYDNFSAFKLIVCCSSGSSYEHYLDRVIALEMKHTDRYIQLLRQQGYEIEPIRNDLNHMLASALFKGIFEAVAHDLPKEEAADYIRKIEIFFHAGWDKLFGLI